MISICLPLNPRVGKRYPKEHSRREGEGAWVSQLRAQNGHFTVMSSLALTVYMQFVKLKELNRLTN